MDRHRESLGRDTGMTRRVGKLACNILPRGTTADTILPTQYYFERSTAWAKSLLGLRARGEVLVAILPALR
jgi:hypothetical protein